MESEPKLLLDPKQWPRPVLAVIVIVVIGISVYAYPNLRGANNLLVAFMMAGCIEWTWKKQAFFAFKREDDAFIFWFSIFMFSLFFLFSLFLFYAMQVSP